MKQSADGASRRPYVAGIDSSTQSCKILIVDPSSGVVVREGHAPHPEGTEVSPDAWWEAFLQAVEQAGGLDDVAAMSVGGQQHGMICLDAEGQVIRPAILWNDTRSAEAATTLIEEAGNGDPQAGMTWWAAATGSVPVASLTVTKLRWLADNEPENAKRIAAVCLPHDWLTWRIAGTGCLEELVTDRSDASGTGYMAREGTGSGGPGAGEYRGDILASALKIDEAAAAAIRLPRILGPKDIAGHGDPRRGWEHIVLAPGCGDNAGAALGLGLKPGEAMLSLGTSGVVAVVSERSVVDPSGLVAGFSDASGRWLPLACTLNAARIIDAIAAAINADYNEFDDLALSVPSAGGLVLTPYFEGERTPNLPNATASLTGMTLANTDRAHIARAAVEGLLALMTGALEAVRTVGVPIERVLLVGGGAKSAAVRQLAGEALGVPVEVPTPGEYVALGAAKQAAYVGRQVAEVPDWPR
ncbi:xylulose kinase [Propionibacterium australiense]|nr:xylulose kinase [Propionibacterium australiense]RLP12651.1 xylulose kinase [Propionibacterium australiense]